MTISYTDNFGFPILDTGSSNWGAGFNGTLEKLDVEIKAAQTPLVLKSTLDNLVIMATGETVLQHYQL
jgi:hypothetical protein